MLKIIEKLRNYKLNDRNEFFLYFGLVIVLIITMSANIYYDMNSAESQAHLMHNMQNMFSITNIIYIEHIQIGFFLVAMLGALSMVFMLIRKNFLVLKILFLLQNLSLCWIFFTREITIFNEIVMIIVEIGTVLLIAYILTFIPKLVMNKERPWYEKNNKVLS